MSERRDDDATVLRAAPAAPRVAEAHAAPARSAAPPTPDLDAAMQAAPGAMRGNALVRAATPLLLLAVQLRHSVRMPDIGALREGCCARLHRFEDDACRGGADAKAAKAARYVLCTLLDEAVLASPWGEGSGWSQRTLLVIFHGETYGGAKVFDLLDRLARDPARHLDLLELLYLTLTLGFGGRYLVEPGGQARLADRQAELHRLIQRQRAPVAPELSPQWRGVDAPLAQGSALKPLAIAAVVSVCLLAVVFLLLHARLNRMTAPISAQLAGIGLERATLPGAAPRPAAPPVSLAGFLEPEQRAGLLTVSVDDDGRSTIRISSAAMFVSGGTEVDARQHPLLRRIAEALNSAPGRVVVVGHTDDQPVHSLRIKDNYALSSLRAENVGALIAAGLSDPRRIETSGAGDAQPIATPPHLPENRARNRRVEIVLIPEG